MAWAGRNLSGYNNIEMKEMQEMQRLTKSCGNLACERQKRLSTKELAIG